MFLDSARWMAPAVAAACLVAGTAGERAAFAEDAAGLAARVGLRRGVAVVVGDGAAVAALDLARRGDLVLYVHGATAEDVEAARRAADEAGLYGRRIFVGGPGPLPLADNVADAVVVLGGGAGVRREEVLRVLRPEGRAVLAGEEIVKPVPDGVDDWRHHYHGPDNNPQSQDRLARAPYLTQFVAEPRYGPAPQACVASGGRLFMAFGHVAWHEREEPVMNTLLGVSGYNGTTLWRRALRPGAMVDRCTMVATPTALYLADEGSCKVLDAATGEVRDEITVPADLVGGTHWKWMALEGGILYALLGEAEPADAEAKWKSRNHGWPWGGISQGYNAQEYAWGFAGALVALDPASKRVLWHHRESEPIDSRGTCLRGGRVFLGRFGRYLACLDARTGRPLWRRTAEKDPDLFQAIGPYRPGHGYVGGWKTTVYLKCTDRALYVVGPQVNWLTALSAETGDLLWKFPAKDLHIVIRDDGLYTIGSEGKAADTHRLDPMTGSVLADYAVNRRACTRSTGTVDGIFFRASEGSARLDTAAGRTQWVSPMRPSCHVGVVVAHGHLYWVPWTCDCNLQMFGIIGLGPAGARRLDAPAKGEERLEPARDAPAGGAAAALEASVDDWPTYRADAARSGRSRAAVAEKAAVAWRHEPRAPVEPTAPVMAGGLVFVAGLDGVVRALDADSGRPRWTAYTGGAVRYPPTVAGGRALVGSGDGWVYAFEAATGRRLWRFRAAPEERRIPIYGTLLSTWPVTTGVLVEQGTAYFAAGINAFDGTHVYAVDAGTGAMKWHNGGSGHLDAFSRRGVAAQGDLALAGGRLYLAGGNAVSPGMFDAATGQCLNDAPTTPGSRAPRGRELVVGEGGVKVCGQPLYSVPEAPVFDKSVEWADPVVVTANAKLTCENRGAAREPAWALVARRAEDGAQMWAEPLPAEPVRWGVAVDSRGRIAVALRTGAVVGLGGAASR